MDILKHTEKYVIARIITRYILKNADTVTRDVHTVKRKLVELAGYPPKKIVVFPWGLELDKFNPHVDGSAIPRNMGMAR